MPLNELDLFGTSEPLADRRLLSAGTLTAVLEAGQLRDIRWRGVEVVRGIAYLVRDAAWGTLPVRISELDLHSEQSRFGVSYTGHLDGPAGRLGYRAKIEGSDEGVLSFEVTATAETDVETNRIGFVLLHPDHAAGRPLQIGHGDGSSEATTFPSRISADQPAFDIISLEHEPAQGVTARVEFEGGIWEMEDQRNWSDASFKTYVRPLAWPRPYMVPRGTTEIQRVTLHLSGRPEARGTPGRVAPSAARDRVPPLHLRLAEGHPVPESLPLPRLAKGLVLRIRPGEPDLRRLDAAVALAERERMSLAVEAVFPQKDPEGETAACLAALEGRPVSALLVTAERDLRTRPSGQVPAGEAPLEATLAALRRGFSGRVGTGTPAFFTEFNRNPPPPADFAFFGINPIVHAADDLSVMETLQTHAAIMESAAQLLPGVGFWPGPLAIAPTVNPYGPGLAETDGLSRTSLAVSDPRHGALFGAAHLLAAVAGVLPWAEAVVPLHASGPTGIVDSEGSPYPLAFVHAELGQAEGAALVPAPSAPAVAGLAWEREGRGTVLLANTGVEDVEIPLPAKVDAIHVLAPGSRGWEAWEGEGASLRIGSYRTVRLTERAQEDR